MHPRTFAQTSLTWSFLASLAPTRITGIDRRLAAAIVVTVAAAIFVLLAVASAYQPPKGAASGGDGDMAMYSRIVERMHGGEGYYEAAHAELRNGGYGTRSVFNWRLPTTAFAESLLPSLTWASALLGLGAAAALMGAVKLVRDTSDAGTAALAGLALAASLFAFATPAAALFTEIPAGMLVLASLTAYGLKRPALGIAFALAALFVRELAAPYVLVCIALAWRDGRRSELWAWAVGLAAFAAFFAWHFAMVQAHVGPADIAYKEGWLQLGGIRFILAASAFNGVMIATPLWQTALLLPLCLLGLVAWRQGQRAVITVAAYLCVFAIAGKPFNDYWGALFTPVMMLGLAFVPAAIRDLAATRNRAIA